MMSLENIRNEGLLERYVIGDLSVQEVDIVERALREIPALKEELQEIEQAFTLYAHANAIEPDPTTKPFLMTFLNYTERLKAGEAATFPPALNENTKVDDYKQWLDRPDLQEPKAYESMHGFIIGHTEERTNLIVWLKHGAPDETHTDELEKFFIVEGTCNIVLDDKEVHPLKPGDYFAIPLHISHRVEVTSNIPCKVILERKKVAA